MNNVSVDVQPARFSINWTCPNTNCRFYAPFMHSSMCIMCLRSGCVVDGAVVCASVRQCAIAHNIMSLYVIMFLQTRPDMNAAPKRAKKLKAPKVSKLHDFELSRDSKLLMGRR